MQNFPQQGQQMGGGGYPQGMGPGGGPNQGGGMGGMQMGGPRVGQVPFPPDPTGMGPQHMQTYKNQLGVYQQQKSAQIQNAHRQGLITQEQMSAELHAVNQRIHQAFNKFTAQCQQMQMQQQGGGQGGPGSSQGGPGSVSNQGQMPPPQMMMSQADKKRMMEMAQKQRMAQQQQRMQYPMGQGPSQGMGGGGQGGQGLTPQQQQHMRMQQFQQQNQFRGQPGGGPSPQYPQPGMQGQQQQQMNQQMNQQQPQIQQHQQGVVQERPGMMTAPPTPQPAGGPPSVPQQFQQQGNNPQQQMAQQQMQAQAEEDAKKAEEVQYKELLKEMREKYYEVCTGLLKRQNQTKGLGQMVKVLEGQRVVSLVTLIGLKPGMDHLLKQECPTFELIEALRKLLCKTKEDRAMAASLTFDKDPNAVAASQRRLQNLPDAKNPIGVNPYSTIRHLEIRVPDHIQKLYKKPEEIVKREEPEEEVNKLKRPREAENTVDGTPPKKVKTADGEKDDDVESQVEEDITGIPPCFLLNPVVSTRGPWVIPPQARDELSVLSDWSIDPENVPSSRTAPFIILLIKNPYFYTKPLRIFLPKNYPIEPCNIQFDRCFVNSKEDSLLQKLFEDVLGSKESMRTITDYVAAYREACQQYQCYVAKRQQNEPEKETTHSNVLMESPSQLSQFSNSSSASGSSTFQSSSQLKETPEEEESIGEYETVTSAPTTSTPIAQKGIVM